MLTDSVEHFEIRKCDDQKRQADRHGLEHDQRHDMRYGTGRVVSLVTNRRGAAGKDPDIEQDHSKPRGSQEANRFPLGEKLSVARWFLHPDESVDSREGHSDNGDHAEVVQGVALEFAQEAVGDPAVIDEQRGRNRNTQQRRHDVRDGQRYDKHAGRTAKTGVPENSQAYERIAA